MNFREMRAKLIASYGKFVFFPDDYEISKLVSTRAFSHLVIDEDSVVLYTPKIMEQQIDEELEESYDVVYDTPKFSGMYNVSPSAKLKNINFKFRIGEDILKKALRKPFCEEVDLIRDESKKIEVALQRFWERIELGMEAKEIKAILDCELLKAGIEEFVYPTIISIGKNSLHAYPRTTGVLNEGEILYVDSSPSLNGYPLNFSRVIFTEERKDWLDALDRINDMYSKIGEVGAGMSCNDLDQIIREVGNFPHYSVVPSGGFYQPFAPGGCILEENMLGTIVPSVYTQDGVIRVKRNIIVQKSSMEFLV